MLIYIFDIADTIIILAKTELNRLKLLIPNQFH